jgi:radical SAM-linked protein
MNQEQIHLLKVTYSKTGPSKYVAHLDTIGILSKAIRRLNLAYDVTKGCHMRPKISFAPPLPLGHASYCEYFILSLTSIPELNGLKELLSKNMPSGMEAVNIEILPDKPPTSHNIEKLDYRLTFTDKSAMEKAQIFLTNEESSFKTISKKKTREYYVKEAILSVSPKEIDDKFVISAEFVQGKPNVPSVSKIVSALADHLKDEKHSLILIERLKIEELNQ